MKKLSSEELIAKKIRHIPDFPKKGILFHDVTTLIKDHEAFELAVKTLKRRLSKTKYDVVCGIESRGFVFGAVLAYLAKKDFVLIRKAGKLPAKTIAQEYALEYGTAKIEIHHDALKKNTKVLIVDDLLATGGTMLAACKLVEKLGAKVAGCAFIIEMPDLGGRKKLQKYPVFHLVEFGGE